jgi:hypothetical protein
VQRRGQQHSLQRQQHQRSMLGCSSGTHAVGYAYPWHQAAGADVGVRECCNLLFDASAVFMRASSCNCTLQCRTGNYRSRRLTLLLMYAQLCRLPA